ncbi:hypothetical protein QQY66_38080 [Streptomyces sp. DG2A-72]|uniref:hypothetical protein n=1 Tax=Streptomyces sp. DG2A-72 TaxID=3051386 RepID=UPI00265C42D5|nr:hypothetical protein [Streptomyces sp. DG2A-72]MDO0937249.1 hypothetical protein [Streptomyces sp. DG2A-72]
MERVTGATFTHRSVVPPSTTATWRVPTADPESVREGRTPLARVPGVKYLGYADGTANCRIPSGSYRVTCALR